MVSIRPECYPVPGGMMSTDANVGKPPEQVDEEQPDSDVFEQWMEENTESTSKELLTEDKESLNGQQAEEHSQDALPSRSEMWQVIQEQQQTIEAQTEQVARLTQRVQALEDAQEESEEAIEEASTTIQEATKQLRAGKLEGEAGAELLSNLNDFNPRNKTDARAWWLYLQLVERSKVGQPVPTSQISTWRSHGDIYFDGANPNQTIHRVMKKLQSLTEEGLLMGQVDTYLRRGERCVELVGGQDE